MSGNLKNQDKKHKERLLAAEAELDGFRVGMKRQVEMNREKSEEIAKLLDKLERFSVSSSRSFEEGSVPNLSQSQ